MANENRCKVDFVVDQYNLDAIEVQYSTIDDHLYARWTGENGRPEDGYRTLTEWFNKRILKRVYDQQGRKGFASRLDTDYEILIGDDELLREDLKDELRSEGIDADRLVRSFISWGSMRTHLQDCLDGEKSTVEAETDWEVESINIATDIVAEKAEQAIGSLSSKGKLSRGDEAEIEIQVQLSCPDCPTRIPLQEALERGFICKEHK